MDRGLRASEVFDRVGLRREEMGDEIDVVQDRNKKLKTRATA